MAQQQVSIVDSSGNWIVEHNIIVMDSRLAASLDRRICCIPNVLGLITAVAGIAQHGALQDRHGMFWDRTIMNVLAACSQQGCSHFTTIFDVSAP